MDAISQSISRAIRRPFVRPSRSGIHVEAEIRRVVQALEVPPDTRREEVLDRLEALVEEVGGKGTWMGRRAVRQMIAERRERTNDARET